jgi:hypothetical protein
VWRIDSYDDPTGSDGLWGQPVPATGSFATDISLGEPEVVPVNQAASAWDEWRNQLSAIGGVNPLTTFDDRVDTRVDITHAHPGGLARFIAGSPTLLGNLIRDDLQRRAALHTAFSLADHEFHLNNSRGIESIALGIGLVSWEHEGVTHRGPLLLRPVTIKRRGSDVEFTLQKSGIRLNPALAREFDRQLQLRLDEQAFIRLTDDNGAFKPNQALDRLRDLTAHRDDVAVSARLLISSFTEVAAPLLADAGHMSHPIVDALGGNQAALDEVHRSRVPVEVPNSDRRHPDADRLIVDADAEQDLIVAHMVAGNSMTVRSLPGTGATQTIVNGIGALVAQNKRVLVISPRQATLIGISDRLTRAGLPGLAVSVRQQRADLIRAIGRNEKAKQPDSRDIDGALERLRTVIIKYRQALTAKDPVVGVSMLECVHELSSLSLRTPAPETTAKLSTEALAKLAGGREDAAALLVEAANLGQFRFGPADSAWYGVKFENQQQAQKAHQIAKRLHSDILPRFMDRARAVLDHTPLPAPTSLSQMAQFIHLLANLRDSLDRFVPAVFDRSLSEVIVATGNSETTQSMPRIHRRRLRQLAKEYIRPGMHVTDLHQSLRDIQEQRQLWQRFVDTGQPPTVPAGVADVQAILQEVEEDVSWLNQILHRAHGDRIDALDFDDMMALMAELAKESDVLQTLEERAHIADRLEAWQLGPLVEDLANRHVDDNQVESELELAWWRGALEHVLAENVDLLGQDAGVLHRLEADYRLVDEAHAASSATRLAWQLSERWSVGLMDWPEEASWLKKALTSGNISANALHHEAPHLARALAPVWTASPYDAWRLPADVPFDTVILVDAGTFTVAEAAPSIKRARQVVAFADPVTQCPEPFEVSLLAGPVDRSVAESSHVDSAFSRLATLLPSQSLTRSYRVAGEDLADLIDRKFYGGDIYSLPWAGSFLGHRSVDVTYVEDGVGMPDPRSGIIESVDAEVKTVVDFVIDYAVTKPKESLMVVSASRKHATRVFGGVLQEVASRPDLQEYFTSRSTEPFISVSVDQAQGLSRDRVIFSLGFGRTPHGRVLSDLGILGADGGERLLAIGMSGARRHLRIVSCFTADELNDARLDGVARALGTILRDADNPTALDDQAGDPDPMLIDLSKRLRKLGLDVSLNHHGVIPLVASYGGVCIALDTDQELLKHSIRESLRLRPQALARLGWHYMRVHLFELFADPDQVAHRIARRAGAIASESEHSRAGA